MTSSYIPVGGFSQLQPLKTGVDLNSFAQARRTHTELVHAILAGSPIFLLFDKDGLLVNTELVRKVAWINAFERFGIECGFDTSQSGMSAFAKSIQEQGWVRAVHQSSSSGDLAFLGDMGGLSESAVDKFILEHFGAQIRASSQYTDDESAMKLIRGFRGEALKSPALDSLLNLKPEVRELLDFIEAHRTFLRDTFGSILLTGIVTSDKLENLVVQGERFNFAHCFDTTVTAGEPANPKPFPDGWELAIQRLLAKLEIKRAPFVLGFEDAAAGVQSLSDTKLFCCRGVHGYLIPDLVDVSLGNEGHRIVKASDLASFRMLFEESVRVAHGILTASRMRTIE